MTELDDSLFQFQAEMAKKKAFSKGGAPNASNAAKGVFKVSSVQHKKKAKVVKTQIKKVNLYDEMRGSIC